jgi:hypothetical protein
MAKRKSTKGQTTINKTIYRVYSNVYCETIFSTGKKVQTDNKSKLGINTKEGRAADNVYLGAGGGIS